MNRVRPADVALEFVKRINARDLDGLTALMTDHHTFIDYLGNVERGRDLMREAWAGYFSSFPEYRIHVGKVLASGDSVAIIGRTTGSHVAPEIENNETLVWTAEVDTGFVAEWRIYATSEDARLALARYAK